MATTTSTTTTFFTTVVIVVVIAAAPIASATQTISVFDPLVQRMGRTYPTPDNKGIAFEWLGSGFRVAHTGTTLWATALPTSKPYTISYAQSDEGFIPPQGATWVTPASAGTPFVVAR